MGKALYRTHRSRTFDEVVGQQHITETLKHAISKGSVSHAYLFTGPRGVGKTSVARILAHEINHLPYTDESTHLDIIEIDAASNRRIDEIRDLRDKVHIAPTSAKYKVYIIDEVHMLTREAFNALLKTLEEPPEHVVFILATTEAHKVPDTIISRTQRFHFKPVEQMQAVTHLSLIAQKEGIQVTDEGLAVIARQGRGSFRDSISLLDQLAGLNKDIINETDVNFLLGVPSQELVNGIISALQNNDTSLLFEHLNTARIQGTEPSLLAKSISQTIRDQLVENRPTLSHERSIAICRSLLGSNAVQDYMYLELALLEHIEFNENLTTHRSAQPSTATKIARVDTPPQETISNEVVKPPKQQPAAVAATKNSPSADKKTQPSSSTWSWPDLLSDLKGHHNTLYGVLRMAEADITEQQITLRFKFSFHKQQVESPQHKKILTDFVARHFGPITIVTEVINSHNTSETTKTNSPPETPDPMEAVSNIFGNAELLE